MDRSSVPDVVHSLWIGEIGPIEEICLRSFVRSGFQFNLWSYAAIAIDIPGVVICRAEDILPHRLVDEFRYENSTSKSPFSNIFRYRLLADLGGIWVDMDNVCLRPFKAESEYVFPSLSGPHQLDRENAEDGGIQVDSWFIKAPAGSPLMEHCFAAGFEHRGKLPSWGTMGPALLNEGVRRFGLREFAAESFMPINWHYAYRYPKDRPKFKAFFETHRPTSWTAHLYREILSVEGLLDMTKVHPSSVLAGLFREFGVKYC
jgi:hypothetical protein